MKNCVLAFDNKMCIKANKQQILDLEKVYKNAIKNPKKIQFAGGER